MWKARNDAAFSGSIPNPLGTFFQITNWSLECLHTRQLNPTQNPPENRMNMHFNDGWRTPRTPFRKFNSDAGFMKENGKGAIGVICRDSHGTFITASAKKIFAPSPLVAEALGLREAVVLATNLGVASAIFESDCMDLVETCRGSKVKDEIKGTVTNI